MILLQSTQNTENGVGDAVNRFVRQGRRLGILFYDDATVRETVDLLDSVRTALRLEGGQEVSFDLEKIGKATLPSLLGAALDERRRERPFRINLPIFPDDFPKSSSPFIARAILWQRLCDRLIEDEERDRSALLVLEHFDDADEKMRHDLTRLIRFHQFHRIRRSFLLTLHRDRSDFLEPDLLEFVEERFEL